MNLPPLTELPLRPRCGPTGTVLADSPEYLLTVAAEEGNDAAVEQLVLTGVDVNAFRHDDEYVEDSPKTALMYAAINNRETTVQLLLQAPGIQVYKTNKDSYTALHFATVQNSINIVRMILSTDASGVSLQTKFGMTALMLAASGGFPDLLQLLLSTDSSTINLKNRQGYSALRMAKRDLDDAYEMVRRFDTYESEKIRRYTRVVQLLTNAGAID